jgi:signal transduction histidine kinase
VREIEEKAKRLEREREVEAQRAVAEEQARIARELHDVVAHALSVIVVQAAAADDVFDVDPRRAREPIRAIELASRAALGDLRRVLGVLQDGAEYEPQPGLGHLDGLVEQVRATGLDVSLEFEGAARPLPAAVDLSAYRIVQEALTNTLKHAGAAHATVRVRYGDDLRLEIRDDGDGVATATVGSGLIGMRERVTMLGGSVDAGARPEGGYLVSAHIPI